MKTLLKLISALSIFSTSILPTSCSFDHVVETMESISAKATDRDIYTLFENSYDNLYPIVFKYIKYTNSIWHHSGFYNDLGNYRISSGLLEKSYYDSISPESQYFFQELAKLSNSNTYDGLFIYDFAGLVFNIQNIFISNFNINTSDVDVNLNINSTYAISVYYGAKLKGKIILDCNDENDNRMSLSEGGLVSLLNSSIRNNFSKTLFQTLPYDVSSAPSYSFNLTEDYLNYSNAFFNDLTSTLQWLGLTNILILNKNPEEKNITLTYNNKEWVKYNLK